MADSRKPSLFRVKYGQLRLSWLGCQISLQHRIDLSQIDRETKGANVIGVRQIKVIKFIISVTIQAT